MHPLFQVLISLCFQFSSSYPPGAYINRINIWVAIYHCSRTLSSITAITPLDRIVPYNDTFHLEIGEQGSERVNDRLKFTHTKQGRAGLEPGSQ